MTLMDPLQRQQRGRDAQAKLTGTPVTEPSTLLESSWPDFLFAEVWTRPGLDLRARYLISMSNGASGDTPTDILDGYVRGALTQSLISISELREAALHLAVYAGWSRGTALDRAITRVARALQLDEAPYPPLRDSAWDPAERLKKGSVEFERAMTFGGPPPAVAYFEAGILNFVFGEMWHRDGLDQRSRRWITLVGVADSSATTPIQSHIYAAMASGNCSEAEMHEFVLQYAIHSGWPKASFIQGVVFEMAKRVRDGLTWDGKPKESANDRTAK